MTPPTAGQRRDLMEIIDGRHDRASTIVARQVPVEFWHEHIGNPTVADAVLDRRVHGAHRLDLTGESMRKPRADKARLDGAAASQANFARSQTAPSTRLGPSERPAGFARNRRLAWIGNTG